MAESKKAAAKKKPAAAPKKSKAAAGVEEATSKVARFDLNAVMSDSLQEIEKKTGLSSNGFGRHCARLSTGLVALDMYLDGGLIPGGWYTTAGPEQSAKSTLTMTLVAACIKQKFNGVGALFDYEGSSDEDYIVNMMKNFGITNADRSKIFGVQDPDTGKYIVRGVFRYYDPTNGEAFFQYMQMLRRRLPDKTVTEKGEAYYVFEHTVKNKKMLAGQYDQDFLRTQNLLRVPAADTSMQSLTVVDSYPAMLPDQQDDDDPSGAMALQARMFSDGIKRFRGGMRRKMMTILGVNQLRERPAQQHGDPNYEPCFVGSTPVHLADGTVDTIRNIVLKKRDVEVLSFDKETGEVSAKRIIDWKDNGNKLTEDLVVVQYKAFDHNGCGKVAEFTATKDHKVWTPRGWMKAGELRADDDIYLNLPRDSYVSDQQQIIYGALLGDGSFDCADDSIGWNVTFNHVRYQVPYMMWKAQALDFGDVYEIPNDSNIQRYKPSGEKSGFTTFKHFNPEIAEYARVLKSNHTKYGKAQIAATKSVLDKLDLRGLAVWYMDDGHFANDRKNGMWVMTISCDRFNAELKAKAIDVIESLTGVRATVHESHGKLFIAGKESCLQFQTALSDYIHPSMSYKLYECDAVGGYRWAVRDPKVVDTLHPTKVVAIDTPDLKSKYTRVYDLTVEDNHTYFVGGSPRNCDLAESRVRRSVRADGVAVSNCGNALKFYCAHPETVVDYLDEDGVPAKCTAHEYHERYAELPAEERPPIRVPSEQGWAVPTEVFETDGGKYADRETFMVRTARKVMRGSAGHSILTATKVKVPHPYSDDVNGWSDDIELPSGIPAFNAADEDEQFAEWRDITAPRIGWSRLHNIRYRDNDVWAFTDIEGLESFDVSALWAHFIKEVTPEFYRLFTEHTDPLLSITERLAEFNAIDAQWLSRQQGVGAERYDVAFQQFAYIEELVNVYLNYSDDNKCVPERITEITHAEPEMQTKRYIDFSVGGSWYSSGIVSHNSDVRIRVMPRAVPDAFKNCNPQRGVIEEPSVEFGNKRVDRYKFISGRTIKNKLGGIPNQEFWARIWEADGKGNARGFDPVYDSYFYLKQIGLLVGQRNKMKFLDPVPLSGARRAITWQELKVLIVGKTEDMKELYADLGVKPFNLRTWCFKYCKSVDGRQRCRDSIVEKQQAAAAEDDE